MSYTKTNVREVEDSAPKFDMPAGMQARFARSAIEGETLGLSLFRLEPGFRIPFGHKHVTQEEVYVVVRGSGRMKLDDEIVALAQWDAVRVPPGTWRGYEAGPDGLEILVIGAPSLGASRREDVEGRRDWWAD
jgi:mannose-6-phosphate isomerase-like protein (cupin superfamily)